MPRHRNPNIQPFAPDEFPPAPLTSGVAGGRLVIQAPGTEAAVCAASGVADARARLPVPPGDPLQLLPEPQIRPPIEGKVLFPADWFSRAFPVPSAAAAEPSPFGAVPLAQTGRLDQAMRLRMARSIERLGLAPIGFQRGEVVRVDGEILLVPDDDARLQAALAAGLARLAAARRPSAAPPPPEPPPPLSLFRIPPVGDTPSPAPGPPGP